MTPWIKGFQPVDQYSPSLSYSIGFPLASVLFNGWSFARFPNRALPWETFPACAMYTCFLVHVIGTSAYVFHCCFSEILPSAYEDAMVHSVLGGALFSLVAGLVLSTVPSLLVFAIFIWWHSRYCSASGFTGYGGKGGGDCTDFVQFKDPFVHRIYKGTRIDMETLYEMYFDEQLDFKQPGSSADNNNSHVCLMKDILSRRHEFVDYTLGLTTHLPFLVTKWIPDVLGHSKSQDIYQVRDHYDRSKFYAERGAEKKSMGRGSPFTSDEAEDDFFGMFLGRPMVYTSGISACVPCANSENCANSGSNNNASSSSNSNGKKRKDPEMETIDEMQDAKIKLICRKLRLCKGDTHLDIGCGWGTLVNYSASRHGTIATGVTLSRNQAAYATAMSKKMKINDHRTVFWCRDYRDIPTNVGVQYSKISCIEMAEHVGVKNFLKFLRQVRDLLEDDGIFLLQIAGLRRAFQYEDLVWGLFMAKYIFPGADASMPLNWVVGQLELAGFEVAQVDNIGIHYSLTLKKWYENWVSNRSKIVEKHGERWFRIFHFFLAWSTYIAGSGAATCYQITCHKNLNSFDRRKLDSTSCSLSSSSSS